MDPSLVRVKPGRWWKQVVFALAAVLLVIPGTIMALLLVVPLVVTGRRTRDRSFPYWAAYIVSFAIYVVIRGLADDIGPGPFVDYPIVLDRLLGLGTVPTVAMQATYVPGMPRWWDYFGVAIYVTHYFAFPAIAVLTWRLAPAKLPRLLTSVSVCLLLGAWIHLLLPTVPPWLAAQTGHLSVVHRPIVDVLSRISPVIYELGLSNGGGNDVAAMPSMHAAAATLVAAGCWTGPSLVRLAAAGYAALMCIALVYFGEHYVVDILVGAAMALGIWAATPGLTSAIGRFELSRVSDEPNNSAS